MAVKVVVGSAAGVAEVASADEVGSGVQAVKIDDHMAVAGAVDGGDIAERGE